MLKRLMETNAAGVGLAGILLVSLCGVAAGQTHRFQVEDKTGGYKGVEDCYLQSARPDAAGDAVYLSSSDARREKARPVLEIDLAGYKENVTGIGYMLAEPGRVSLLISDTRGWSVALYCCPGGNLPGNGQATIRSGRCSCDVGYSRSS